jgi:hypothetical protein
MVWAQMFVLVVLVLEPESLQWSAAESAVVLVLELVLELMMASLVLVLVLELVLVSLVLVLALEWVTVSLVLALVLEWVLLLVLELLGQV